MFEVFFKQGGRDISIPGINAVKRPETEHEWTVHALNIHGAFFERWCQGIVRAAEKDGWKLAATRYPVEYPSSNTARYGDQGELDIRADLGGGKQLILPIECKKNNPEFINWIFFRGQQGTKEGRPEVRQVWSSQRTEGFVPQIGVNNLNQWSLPFVYEGREVRGTYKGSKDKGEKDKTKTSNHEINQATYQVARATQYLIYEECERRKKLFRNEERHKQFFLPVVVTTARLHILEFDSADVNASTGEIPYDEVTMAEEPWLLYEYPLPCSLQGYPPEYLYSERDYWIRLEQYARLSVVIVHSGSFADFLSSLAKNIDSILP